MTDAPRGGAVADGATRRPQAARPRKPAAGWVFGAALGAFFAALALLAFQVRAGEDPALGPAPAAQQAKPRQVLIRRVIKRVVVHHPPDSAAAPPAAVRTSAPAPATAAPAPAAPAPPAPAPAAPAPLTTQSS
jgi:hypothetical protein